ncbi:M16 family metallopeptidase [Amycolatopsis pigmentata]|uniref:M16 family metallopeptidase n=1 Tax=Amycolatopsis pigmentata TaxID=450801 RepID=A0ABW5G143_9PSEU
MTLARPRLPETTTTGWSFPGTVTDRLPGGLSVLTCALPGQELVAAELVIDLPLAAEPAHFEGVAGVATFATVEATEGPGGGTLTEHLEQLGAAVNANVRHEGLVIGLSVPRRNLGPALEALFGAVYSATPDDAQVERLAAENVNTIAQNRADPAQRAATEFVAACVEGGRWSRPTTGVLETARNIDPEAVATFLRQLRTAPATLVVAGDIGGMDVPAITGVNAPRDLTDRAADSGARPRQGAHALVVDRPGAVQTCLAIGSLGVNESDPRWADLNVAGCVLGGALWSRLSARLREEMGYTYGITARFQPWRHHGLFAISTSVDSESTEPAVADIRTIVAGVVEEGLTKEEHRRAVDLLLGGMPLRYQTADAVAVRLADNLLRGLPADHVDHYQRGLGLVTAQSASEAFATVVTPEALTLVAVGDAGKITEPLLRQGFESVEVVSA